MFDSGRQITTYQRLQRHISLTWYPISIALFMFCLMEHSARSLP